MFDPFVIVQYLATNMGLAPWQVAGLTAIVAGMIGFSITSLMSGNPQRAIKIAVSGLALLLFFLFSRISGAITGI